MITGKEIQLKTETRVYVPRTNSPATPQKVAILAGVMFASQVDKYG